MATFTLDIVTPGRDVFSEEVESVVVPGATGMMEVLPRHMALVSLLKEGEIKITTKDRVYYLAIGEGFIEVRKDKVEILVSRAYHADELNEAEIKKAQESAKELLSKKATETERMEAYAVLRRSVLEMKVVAHRKRQRPSVAEITPSAH